MVALTNNDGMVENTKDNNGILYDKNPAKYGNNVKLSYQIVVVEQFSTIPKSLKFEGKFEKVGHG